jgi:hypothetical protein
MIRLAAFASLAVLTLAACDPAPPPADAPAPAPAPEGSPPATETLTSRGLGPVQVGMAVAALDEVWGGPKVAPGDPQGCNVLQFNGGPAGVWVMTQNGKVTNVSVNTGASVKTDRGFGLGDDGAAVKAAYGASAVVIPNKYDPLPAEYITVWDAGVSPAPYVEDPSARGLRYATGTDGKVRSIAGGDPTIQLVEGCG